MIAVLLVVVGPVITGISALHNTFILNASLKKKTLKTLTVIDIQYVDATISPIYY